MMCDDGMLAADTHVLYCVYYASIPAIGLQSMMTSSDAPRHHLLYPSRCNSCHPRTALLGCANTCELRCARRSNADVLLGRLQVMQCVLRTPLPPCPYESARIAPWTLAFASLELTAADRQVYLSCTWLPSMVQTAI